MKTIIIFISLCHWRDRMQNGGRARLVCNVKNLAYRGGTTVQRRTFLKLMSGATGATVALGGGALSLLLTARRAGALSIGASLAKFVDPLPIPPMIQPTTYVGTTPLFTVTMRRLQQKLHRDLPPTSLWGYNSLYPGPTFAARRGQPIAVQWLNDLPTKHFLPIDPTLHGDEPPTPEVRTVVHLHGHKVLPDSDGYPEAWFTKNFAQTGPFFETRIYHYPNDQPVSERPASHSALVP
jgi:FtsP/CotA-like multicopper oxidase with cupredoxin domain